MQHNCAILDCLQRIVRTVEPLHHAGSPYPNKPKRYSRVSITNARLPRPESQAVLLYHSAMGSFRGVRFRHLTFISVEDMVRLPSASNISNTSRAFLLRDLSCRSALSLLLSRTWIRQEENLQQKHGHQRKERFRWDLSPDTRTARFFGICRALVDLFIMASELERGARTLKYARQGRT